MWAIYDWRFLVAKKPPTQHITKITAESRRYVLTDERSF